MKSEQTNFKLTVQIMLEDPDTEFPPRMQILALKLFHENLNPQKCASCICTIELISMINLDNWTSQVQGGLEALET